MVHRTNSGKHETKQSQHIIEQAASGVTESSKVEQASFDPKVSCPIVCSEYMRATGFFYRARTAAYLITARHNLLPTDARVPNPYSFGDIWHVQTDEYHPVIDVFLLNDGEWEHKRMDIREAPSEHISSDPSGDIFAVRVQFDPEEFGYKVFASEDVTLATEEQTSLVTYGFSTHSLPSKDGEYSIERFKQGVSTPCEFEFENLMLDEKRLARKIEKIHGLALELNAHPDSAYNGLSGAPIIGEGLVGVHSGTGSVEKISQLCPESEKTLRAHYYSARLLKRTLD
jgi:hypothetical protein